MNPPSISHDEQGLKEEHIARPNYQYEKHQKELAKKKKEKLQRKLEEK